VFTDNAWVSTIKPKPLPPRIEKFVAEYMADGCASEAATRAGYSAATSKQAGYRLLRRDD
jgi:phage terminase small subunit